ncbi:MAG: hypothetical protein SFU53_00015 [Terrimicrobiaceae bacterium]|nr:hypothetical protein [Terrimicrobiaceae bacterium]
MESLLDILFYAVVVAIAWSLFNDQGGGKRGRSFALAPVRSSC